MFKTFSFDRQTAKTPILHLQKHQPCILMANLPGMNASPQFCPADGN